MPQIAYNFGGPPSMLDSPMDRFREQLKRQVIFLQNSCHAFDNGQWIEAIRIATSIRVIVHDSSFSVSLLKHLNAKNIGLFTICEDPLPQENGHEPITGFAMGIFTLGPGAQCAYGPDLEDFEPGVSRVLPVDKWWNQVIWILGPSSRLTRKDLVLSAANKDGGAHVDKELDENYKKLATTRWGTLVSKRGPAKFTLGMDDMHLVALRTVANELLKSPEFIVLLGG